MMDLSQLVDTKTGRQSKKIFTDPDLYELEMERIYARCWLFLAHESQIPEPGDFMRTFMGEDEVLVIRQDDGSINAFLNFCPHRGNRICKADKGHQRQFSCAYHGWSFATNGDLIGVPLETEAYYDKLNKQDFGLIPVTQVDTYKGLVFGCFDADGPSLSDYLGDMKWYIDVWLDAMPGGSELLGNTQKVTIDANWKLPIENVAGDGYHLGWAHAGAMTVSTSLGVSGLSVGNTDVDISGGLSIAGLNGHSVLASLDGEDGSGYGFYPDPQPALDYLQQNRATAIEKLGEFRGKNLWGSQINFTIYPNLQFLPGLNWFRVYHPKGPGRYEQWTWAMAEKAMPESLKQQIIENQARTFGPAGLFDNDDGDNLEAITELGRGWRTRQADVYANMALGREHTLPGLPGIITDGLVCEQNQRWMYRRWLDLMQADGWAEVPDYQAEQAELRQCEQAEAGFTGQPQPEQGAA
ncbi:MAG: aromatic ring-hydroxylating dioxygenase subunit alpha [Immundisolibacteraceae bacterium]|nr:aromatic ring-hydroxylating dioxygenase subunit alpha [Immundisolibacteraceae bacterium]